MSLQINELNLLTDLSDNIVLDILNEVDNDMEKAKARLTKLKCKQVFEVVMGQLEDEGDEDETLNSEDIWSARGSSKRWQNLRKLIINKDVEMEVILYSIIAWHNESCLN